MNGAVLVGGGLANCLLALRLRALRPDVPLTLVEGADRLGTLGAMQEDQKVGRIQFNAGGRRDYAASE